MTPFSAAYAENYDSLYREKDYAAECAFLEHAFANSAGRPVKSVLDLGCGTGGHALPLARKGFRLTGVDLSAQMIELARDKAKTAGLGDQIRFETGDLRTFSAKETFDAVICLFAVLSYQTDNQGFLDSLVNMKRHLAPGGLLICDFWYGPSVLTHPPADRCKTIENNGRRLLRLTTPELRAAENVVEIRYQLLEIAGRELKSEATELHRIRYFFKPELEFFFAQAGLAILECIPSFRSGQPLTPDDWTVMIVAQAHG